MKAAAAALLWAAACPALAACPPAAGAGRLVEAGSVQLAWRSEPGTIQVGQPFVLYLTLCPAQAQLLAVDATMPEHRHGMNYRPSLRPLGGGLWRVEGLLWHMSGRWEWRFEVRQAGAVQELRQDVLLP
jgi:predicted small secreted protein